MALSASWHFNPANKAPRTTKSCSKRYPIELKVHEGLFRLLGPDSCHKNQRMSDYSISIFTTSRHHHYSQSLKVAASCPAALQVTDQVRNPETGALMLMRGSLGIPGAVLAWHWVGWVSSAAGGQWTKAVCYALFLQTQTEPLPPPVMASCQPHILVECFGQSPVLRGH